MDDERRREWALFRVTVLGPLVSARLEHGDVRALCEAAAGRPGSGFVEQRARRLATAQVAVYLAALYSWGVANTAENLEPLELEGDPDLTDEERAEVARLWKAEVRRRCAEIDAGTARLVPADEVVAGIRQLIEEHRRG